MRNINPPVHGGRVAKFRKELREDNRWRGMANQLKINIQFFQNEKEYWVAKKLLGESVLST